MWKMFFISSHGVPKEEITNLFYKNLKLILNNMNGSNWIQIKAFVRKEFYHVFRDRKSLLLLFGLPIVLIVLFGFALSNEIKNTEIAILDEAKDEASLRLIQEIEASKYFEVVNNLNNAEEIEKGFKQNKMKVTHFLLDWFIQVNIMIKT